MAIIFVLKCVSYYYYARETLRNCTFTPLPLYLVHRRFSFPVVIIVIWLTRWIASLSFIYFLFLSLFLCILPNNNILVLGQDKKVNIFIWRALNVLTFVKYGKKTYVVPSYYSLRPFRTVLRHFYKILRNNFFSRSSFLENDEQHYEPIQKILMLLLTTFRNPYDPVVHVLGHKPS